MTQDKLTVDYDLLRAENERLEHVLSELHQRIMAVCNDSNRDVMVPALHTLLNDNEVDEQQVWHELNAVSRAFSELAELVPKMIAIRNKHQMTETLIERFNLMQARIGDFSTETDTMLQEISDTLQQGRGDDRPDE